VVSSLGLALFCFISSSILPWLCPRLFRRPSSLTYTPRQLFSLALSTYQHLPPIRYTIVEFGLEFVEVEVAFFPPPVPLMASCWSQHCGSNEKPAICGLFAGQFPIQGDLVDWTDRL
jgi:hypothetical protein